MQITRLLVASLLAAAALTPVSAEAKPYDRKIARTQIAGIVVAQYQRRKMTLAEAQRINSVLAASDKAVDDLAALIQSEGIDIGSPLIGTDGGALLDQIIAKLHDGRGRIEAAIVADRTRPAKPTPGAMPGIPARTTPTVTTPAAPGQSGLSSKSMIADDPTDDGILRTVIRLLPFTDTADQDWEEAYGPKKKCEDGDAYCGIPKTSTGGSSGGGASRPDPNGETRAKPAQLTPGEIEGVVGKKTGQQTNPGPEGNDGTTGRSGPIPPAVGGGGVTDPAGPVTARGAVRAPTAPITPLDPRINPTPDGPKPTGNGPGQPAPSTPGED